MSAAATQPAYAVDGFRDRDAEIARLRTQARAFMSQERPILERLGLPPAGRLLDVGCGPGFVADALEAQVPGLRAYGLDLDASVLPSRRRFASARADRLPIASGAFDAAYARLVLRHLPDPAGAVREMARVVGPGGRVFLADTDDGGLVVSPEPVGFGTILAARQAGFRRRGADPEVGRRLPDLLASAGLEDVRVEVLPVHTGAMGAEAFAGIVLAPICDAIDHDLATPEDVRRTGAAIRDWARHPAAFGTLTVVLASGRRPGGTASTPG